MSATATATRAEPDGRTSRAKRLTSDGRVTQSAGESSGTSSSCGIAPSPFVLSAGLFVGTGGTSRGEDTERIGRDDVGA